MLIPTDFDPDSVKDLSVISDLNRLKSLAGLCYRSETYAGNAGYYGDVYVKIKATVAAGQVAIAAPDPKTADQKEAIASAQVMAAVAFRLVTTPSFAVETEGSSERRSFFSSTTNWEELARDVLDELYLPVGKNAGNIFIVTDRLLTDCGRFQTADEAMAILGRRWWRPYLIGRMC